MQITLLPAVHWSKEVYLTLTKLFHLHVKLGNKSIDITFINIGAYNFFPIMPERDKDTNSEIARMIVYCIWIGLWLLF